MTPAGRVPGLTTTTETEQMDAEPRMASHPTDFDECIGDCYLMRQGATVPITVYVMQYKQPFLKFVNETMETVILTPTDRKKSTLVMEDDAPERIAALRLALESNGWKNVVNRG